MLDCQIMMKIMSSKVETEEAIIEETACDDDVSDVFFKVMSNRGSPGVDFEIYNYSTRYRYAVHRTPHAPPPRGKAMILYCSK